MVKYTDETLKQLHSTILEMLIEFDRICRKYNIPYIIESGTLLGAVRNKGFIEWDDDADIKMLRKDYNKFCEVCEKDLDKNRFFLQNYNTDKNYRWGYAKLLRNNTVFNREKQEMLEMKRGLFIDIFPCDNVPDKFIAKKIFSLKCFWVRKNSYAPVGAKYESNKIYRLFYKILSHNSLAYIRKLYDALACQCLDENTKRVRIVAWSSKRENEGFPRKWMEDRIEYEFEGHYFWDVRRWKTATTELTQPLTGWKVRYGETDVDYYSENLVLVRDFTPKMYFWPIKHDELKRNKRLTQNPGWTYND